ncbi:Protein of unknown function (DUF495) [gamma proteobacterium HdN1]|nr:Protein of unknown function (DUF495) [gamma proteobacterium HdN1]
MSRQVFCRKYKQDLEGLPRPPYPGPRGQMIFEQVSKQAWNEWLKHQTRLINEKRLNLMQAETQAYLAGELEKFLDGANFDQAEGFVPPKS